MDFKVPAAYEVLQHRFISDIRSDGWVLRHKKSGARVMLLANEDPNKVFHITFRTTPKDSTGVAHITEHSVLCGSAEFPLKDPFVELVKGSLNTFLNAMTYPDKTMYPVASCNDRDFANLMHVYLDAVFFPDTYRNEKIFRQEGWHYELESPEGELTLNGVVYNEMKGAFSSPEDVLEREIMNSLFPDTTYGVESGGDPVCIPDLTYEAFLDFHRTYYHPSNSYLYLYGDMDMEERLDWMDRHYLGRFDAIEVDSAIRLQAPFEKMRTVERTYPVSEEESTENASYLAFNAVIGTSLDVELCNAFAVLEYALVETPGAPLKQALLDAGIGNDIMGSYDSGTYQPVFSVISKNANASDKERFLDTIRATLLRLQKEGLDRKALLAGLNLMEFRYREADYGSYPKGLIYGIDLMDSWLYDEEKAFDYVEQLAVYRSLREKVDTGYFEELIRTWILDNPHTSCLVTVPEPGKTAREEERVARLLKEYKDSLSEEELAALVQSTKALKEFQDTPNTEEELRTIPMLERSDIRPEAGRLFNEELEWEGTKVLYHRLFTNGITYLDLLFDVDDVEDLPALGLLKSILGMVDTAHYGYAELNNEINANTGGIAPGISVFPFVGRDGEAGQAYTGRFGLKIRALTDKIPFALDMVKEILLTSSLDNDRRLYEIIAKVDSRLSISLSASGHGTAAARALAYHSAVSACQDAISGIAFYQYVHDLAQNFEERKAAVKEALSGLIRKIFRRERLMLSLTMEENELPAVQKAAARFLEELPGKEGGREEAFHGTPAIKAPVSGEAFTTSGQVQYVARAGNFIRAGFAYTGVLRILKVVMSYEYLWLNVRVKGGAYGCMSSFGRTGDTYFVSYRDPRLRGTNEVYDRIPAYLESFDASERDMTKYVIGTISDLDVPRTPQVEGARSLHAWMCGITDEMLQKERDQILAAGAEDIRALAPLVQAVLDQKDLCVIGSEGKIREDRDLFTSVRPLTS